MDEIHRFEDLRRDGFVRLRVRIDGAHGDDRWIDLVPGGTPRGTAFVHVHHPDGPAPHIEFKLQTSADGVNWVESDAA